jgi:hypothetical protein
MTEEKSTDRGKIFGMTLDEIVETADALSQQKDQNHPTKTGTYQDLINAVQTGRGILSKQDGYCQKRP